MLKTIGMVVVAAFAASVAGRASRCGDDRHTASDQVGRQFSKPAGLIVCFTALFGRDVATLDVPGFSQTSDECLLCFAGGGIGSPKLLGEQGVSTTTDS
jgi:hypothetical protein